MDSMIYLAIFIFSAVLSLGAFIFGHDAEHDAGPGHPSDAGMPSVFSVRVISLFLVGFSGMGLIATRVLNWGAVGSAGAGLGAGLFLGAVAYGVICIFHSQQASSMPSNEDYVNCQGRITIAVPENGTGEVAVTARGQLKSLFAVSKDGSAIPEGRPVKVLSVSTGTATVEKV